MAPPDFGCVGFSGLLNLSAVRHRTVFLSDFPLPGTDIARIKASLAGAPTRVFFLRLDAGPERLWSELARAGVDPARDYISVQVLTSTHQGFDVARDFFAGVRLGDFARVELPCRELNFSAAHAGHLLDVISRADYAEQDRLADLFFALLGICVPYEVSVRTSGALLTVRDSRPWFQLAGRLQDGEQRILPGGEVAYTGSSIDGTLIIDGAILATPQLPQAAPLAGSITQQSIRVAHDPLTLHITSGRITAVTSAGPSAGWLNELLDAEAYREVTELGISFNRACASYIHDWPAASNEGRPGVHIAIGGDPAPDTNRDSATGCLVHVDLMSASTEVLVNGRLFLQTSR